MAAARGPRRQAADAAELARRDADHKKKLERLRTETPRQRAAREKAEAEELRERDEILDDAERVFAFIYVGRDTIDGHRSSSRI